jgi:methyl halide transferase
VPERDWNDHYRQGNMPWDSGTPDPNLVEFVQGRALTRGRALDIGSGTGTQALWLAAQGFDVLGVDLSPLAVERARAKAAASGVTEKVRFAVHDFLHALPDGGPFDFVFDRGVFHVFDAPEDRTRFAAQVARCLAPSGLWLSLIGSTEGPPREQGPPRRSARDIANAIEPALAIAELRTALFDIDSPVPPQAWLCVARPREVPAQPSTS